MSIVRAHDPRGSLVAIEELSSVPFSMRRVFVISDVPMNSIRGNHAHYKSDQFLVAISGSCKVVLDDGCDVKEYCLSASSDGVFQPAGVWGVMRDFSFDCVLLVAASDLYNPNDYIHDYEVFKKWKMNSES